MIIERKMKNKKIGLALGGGAVLGAAHIGVLKAIEEKNIEISYISGTSIGSVIAALYAFGKNAKEIEQIAIDINWSDFAILDISKYGLLSNKKIADLILKHIGNVDFKESNIPIKVVATDISSGEKVIIDSGDVGKAIMASSSIPGIFVPVKLENTLLVDGGLVENVPISPLKDFGAEYVIAVDLNSAHSLKAPKDIIEVLLNSFSFALNTSTKIQLQDANLIIRPDLSEFNPLSTDQIKELIKTGYESAKKELK